MMKNLTFQEKYNAIGKKGTRYEGVFITAVITTGIFCRPACRAPKPNPENVVFYDTAQEALQNGYRPCKICKPMENLNETPQYVTHIISELHQNPYVRIKDEDLRQRGIEPSQIRRWFKENHHMTFHTYQRMLRINTVFNSIQKGRTITYSAFDSGYGSLSRFNKSYRSIFGDPPTSSNASNDGVCLLDFTDRRMLEAEFKELRKRLNTVILPGENPHLDHVQSELQEYFSGKRKKIYRSITCTGNRISKVGMANSSENSLRRDTIIQTTSHRNGEPESHSSGRLGERTQPDWHYYPLPSRYRFRREFDRLWRRITPEKVVA